MKYFTIQELVHSNIAQTNNIDNKPDKKQIRNLQQLVDNVLDPLRERFGKPILISSGFRSKELNGFIGGAKNSQHIKGEAADIYTGTHQGNKIIFDIIKNELPFDQLIDEKNLSWIHVSFKINGNRKQILKL